MCYFCMHLRRYFPREIVREIIKMRFHNRINKTFLREIMGVTTPIRISIDAAEENGLMLLSRQILGNPCRWNINAKFIYPVILDHEINPRDQYKLKYYDFPAELMTVTSNEYDGIRVTYRITIAKNNDCGIMRYLHKLNQRNSDDEDTNGNQTVIHFGREWDYVIDSIDIISRCINEYGQIFTRKGVICLNGIHWKPGTNYYIPIFLNRHGEKKDKVHLPYFD